MKTGTTPQVFSILETKPEEELWNKEGNYCRKEAMKTTLSSQVQFEASYGSRELLEDPFQVPSFDL